MKKIDRIKLIELIGQELQGRMTYADINAYLPQFGVDCKKETSGVNSKRIYVKELLADVDEKIILEIADELGMEHSHMDAELNLSEINFWRPGHFRLFLSHKHEKREVAKHLQSFLHHYGISTFVAHEDIKPTKVWVVEIEKALQTMDALAAVLTTDFRDSDWTDQEVGSAISRNIVIIPIMSGLSPYGFMEKYQGLKTTGKSVGQVARDIYLALMGNQKTRSKIFSVIVEQLLNAKDPILAQELFNLLKDEESNPLFNEMLLRFHSNLQESDIFMQYEDLLKQANQLFQRNGLGEISQKTEVEDLLADLPF